ncbi:MAG TPA: polysaccharide deacetylase family protein, partial [Burkholderiales bacterium]|nr:polysaccharide deacetylase family protein [Burkholderiales bacterium]
MTLKTDHPTPAENGVWRPAPAIRVSMLLHALAVMVLIIEPSWWLWVAELLVGNHLVLTAAVLWPRGRMLGPNLTRLPASAVARGEICLTFDDGPDPQVTPHVLELLNRYGATASFFCIGEKAAAFPALVTEIARCGHSVENHSYRHAHAFAFYGMVRLRREIAAAQAVIAGITGRPPVFFRAPLGFRSPLLDPVLAKFGLRYVSWTRRGYDAVRGNPAQVLRRLTRGLAAGDVLLLHDGAYARTDAG